MSMLLCKLMTIILHPPSSFDGVQLHKHNQVLVLLRGASMFHRMFFFLLVIGKDILACACASVRGAEGRECVAGVHDFGVGTGIILAGACESPSLLLPSGVCFCEGEAYSVVTVTGFVCTRFGLGILDFCKYRAELFVLTQISLLACLFL